VKTIERSSIALKLVEYTQHDNNYDEDDNGYGRYAGTYVQDEMGWSDDDIDTVLDGDPDAYWNID
jgi:hypothetical protein